MKIYRKKTKTNKTKQFIQRLTVNILMIIGSLYCLNWIIEGAKAVDINKTTKTIIDINSTGDVVTAVSLDAEDTQEINVSAWEDKEYTSESSPEYLIEKYFPENYEMAIAIAKAESNLEADRVGDKHLEFRQDGELYGHSIGIFQIRRLPGRPSKDTLLNPEENVKFARQLYEKSGWQPWSAFLNKNYLKFL